MLNNKLFFLIIFILYIPTLLLSDIVNTVQINKETTKLNILHNMEILEDKQNNLSIDDVIKKQHDSSFISATILGNTFGYTQSAFWVRFSVDVDSKMQEAIYLELGFPLMDYATLYTPKSDGGYIESKSGEFIDSTLKEINYRNYIFTLSRDTDQTKTYYMYVKSGTSTQIPLNIFSASTLIQEIDKTNFLFGLYYGNMFILMLIALTAFVKMGDRVFLSYSFYLFTYIFFQLCMNGFFSQYFTPLPLIYANQVTALSLGIVVIAGAIFSGIYLQLWSSKYKTLRFTYNFIILTTIATTFIALFIDVALGIKLTAIIVLLLAPTIFFTAVKSFLDGYTPAKFFLIAWFIFLLGAFTTVLLFLGIIPHTFLTAYSMQIGSTLELLLLTFALTSRVDVLLLEKEQATKKATTYLNQINEGLESLVKERTQELQEKNELLSNLAIRDSMTGMLNHNASIEKLNSMKLTALRYGYSLAVVMLDIDLFKAINDKYGHPAGDKVIIQIADVINKTIRQSDVSGRYGGEEFILILHNTNINDALELSERIRVKIESLQIAEIAQQPITVSLGVTIFDNSIPDGDLIKQADIALYSAKESGRNRVVKFTN